MRILPLSDPAQLVFSFSLTLVVAAATSAVDPPSLDAETTKGEERPIEESSEEDACAVGVVKDDGGVESGYGFVPSSTSGSYVQRFDSSELRTPDLATVCICWLKTRGASEIDFEIVFFTDRNGVPAPEPFAVRKASAADVPRSKETAGRFYQVDVSGISAPEGPFYVGARWNPSAQQFLFVCNDRSPTTAKTDVLFRDDIKPAWVHVDQARDPIFQPHRAIMVRVVGASLTPTKSDVPGDASDHPDATRPPPGRVPTKASPAGVDGR